MPLLEPAADFNFIFGVSLNAVRLYVPFIYRVLYLKIKNFKRSTYIDFAENQLSLSLIGLSPLTTNHLSIFLHTRVRPFNKRYRFKFSLFIVRSLSFGSYIKD